MVDLEGRRSRTPVQASETVTAVVSDGAVPTTFVLTRVHPNPFNPRTTFEFAMPHREEATR